MDLSFDEALLKKALKAALIEVFEERRDLIRSVLEEALEEIALASAIREGEASEPASREQVFALFEQAA